MNDWALLAQCLHALAPQAASEEIEVIVVRASDRTAGVDRQGVTTLTPGLRWIDAPECSTVPHLRGLGIAAARADRIAVIEDDCMVAADWCGEAISVVDRRRLLAARWNQARIGARWIGPCISASTAASCFRCPRRRVLPFLETTWCTRWAIAALPAASRAQFREVFVHDAWQAAGVPTRVTDSLVVNNVNSWSLAHVTSGPFHHGRAYAAQRFGARGSLFRTGIAFLTLGLPFLKVAA